MNYIKWKNIINKEKNKEYFKNMIKFLNISKFNGITIYPKFCDIFNAFKFTNFDKIKVVIVGQDPYNKPNQANGLCFSVNKGIKIPPSLSNIYLEIKRNIKNFNYPKHGYLKKWSMQGILLINLILSVEKNKPLSHLEIGWKIFTKNIIYNINIYKSKIIFLLLGSYAKKELLLKINKKKHYILYTSHPSPLSFNKGFYGCNFFSEINKILNKENKNIIDWQI